MRKPFHIRSPSETLNRGSVVLPTGWEDDCAPHSITLITTTDLSLSQQRDTQTRTSFSRKG